MSPVKRISSSIALALVVCIASARAAAPGFFDSITPETAGAKTEEQEIYTFLLRLLDRWNAHDIDGYMACFWNDPSLLVIDDGETARGWQTVQSLYKRGFVTPDEMGFIAPDRTQIQNIQSGVYLAVTWWTLRQKGGKTVGTSSLVIRAVDGAWRIVAAHISFVEP